MSDRNQKPLVGNFTPSDWNWAAKRVEELCKKVHVTDALSLFFKKVVFSAISGRHGMRASGVWLLGESGSGKTTAIKKCMQELSRDDRLDSSIPSILLPLLPGPTMHTIVRGLLGKLKYPFANARTFGERAELLFDVIRKKNIRVIFIDEVQHIVALNRTANQVEIRDFFKRLLDETNVCLVLSGLPVAKKLREQDQQLASRMSGEVVLTCNFSDPEGRALVEALIDLSPIQFEPSACERVLNAFAARDKANLRVISAVIEEATKIAALMRSISVDESHVLQAFGLTFLRASE